jgi:hypothetical protein
MFLLRKSYLGVGVFMGMVMGAAAVGAAVLSCPQGRCMARRAVKRGKRVMRQMKPMLDR